MNAETLIVPDSAALARAAAVHFVQIGQSAIHHNGSFSVALAGGSTPRPMHRLLATTEFSDQLDWQRVHLFWGDERCVPPDHPDSNYGVAKSDLLDHTTIPVNNVHRIRGEADPNVAAEGYEAELKSHFRTELPRFDLILLGLGADGHIASLFPSAPAITESGRLAVAAKHPLTGQWRMTLTLPALNTAANLAFIVAGADKAEAVSRIRRNDRPDPELPASLVRPRNGHVRWFLDQPAASHLQAAED